MSIKEQLQNAPERGKEITGQELMALEGYGQDNPASNVPGAWRSKCHNSKNEIDSHGWIM